MHIIYSSLKNIFAFQFINYSNGYDNDMSDYKYMLIGPNRNCYMGNGCDDIYGYSSGDSRGDGYGYSFGDGYGCSCFNNGFDKMEEKDLILEEK